MKMNGRHSRCFSLIGIAVCAGLLMVSLSGCNLFNKSNDDPDNQPVTPNTSSETGGSETAPEETTTAAETTATTAAAMDPDATVGYCNADELRIRSGPGTDYKQIGGLKYAEKVDILGKEGDWYKIKFHETGGYVSAQFIQSSEPSPLPSTTTSASTTTTAAPEA